MSAWPPEALDKPDDSQLEGLDFIRSEINLLVFPFFALSTKGLRKLQQIEFRAVTQRDGKRTEIIWTVSANSQHGYPGPFDLEVHRAIEQIITEQLLTEGEVRNPLRLGSLYSLCQRMGYARSGRLYRAIEEALTRIAATTIRSENAFYEKGRRRWTSRVFHLYDAVVFQGEEMLEEDRIADTNYLYLSDLYLESLNAFYVKPLDYPYERSLRCHIARRLYELLGVKFYRWQHGLATEALFRYSLLAQLLPVERWRYLSDAKKQLDPAHNELVATGFLHAYEWRPTADKHDWLLVYWPGPRAAEEIRRAEVQRRLREGQAPLPGLEEQLGALPAPEITLTPEHETLIAALVACHISPATAVELVQAHDAGLIRQWIEALPFVRAQDKAAFLVRAIQGGWALPAEYRAAQKEAKPSRQQQAALAAAAQEARAAERRRLRERAQLDRFYASLPPEEQAAVEAAAEARLPPALRRQIERQREEEGRLSAALTAILESSRYEVLRLRRQQGEGQAPGGEEAFESK